MRLTFAVVNDVHVSFGSEGHDVFGQPVAVAEVRREAQWWVVSPFKIHLCCCIFVWNNIFP